MTTNRANTNGFGRAGARFLEHTMFSDDFHFCLKHLCGPAVLFTHVKLYASEKVCFLGSEYFHVAVDMMKRLARLD